MTLGHDGLKEQFLPLPWSSSSHAACNVQCPLFTLPEFLKRGVPGLSSIKDLPVTQDAPVSEGCQGALHGSGSMPPGGFPSIRIERRLPNTGPTGAAIFGIATAIMGYGFYQLWGAKRDKSPAYILRCSQHGTCAVPVHDTLPLVLLLPLFRFQADEIYTVRSIVHPVLVAEWDLRYLEHQRKEHEREAELMKNVSNFCEEFQK
eukprot:30109-Pelagomonas_calceolata.AAC.3